MKKEPPTLNITSNDVEEIIHSLGKKIDTLSGKTVLIAGANGVVGSYFVNTIAMFNKTRGKKRPVNCICITRHRVTKTSRLGHLLGQPNMYFVTADITQQFTVPLPPDYIVHSASYASPKSYLAKPIETMEANSIGTKRLLDLALTYKVYNMLFISSGSIYGEARAGEGSFKEDHCGYVSPLETRAVYSESKRFGETLCTIYARSFDVHTTIARLSNMYGPGFTLDDGRAIPDFFNQAFQAKRIEIHGDPDATRAYVYIADAIVGMLHILLSGKKGEVYNVASERLFPMRYIASKVCKLFPNCRVIVKKSKTKLYLSGSPVHIVVSSQKLRSEFNWKPVVGLQEGLKRIYKWYIYEERTTKPS